MENIYLIGFMGTGKSTVAKELAKLLPFRIVEMDETIEMLAGMPISQIFESKGEETFRIMETQFLNAISKEKNQIISCGGGIVLKEENVEMMRTTGTICLLDASAKTVYDRINSNPNRPLLKDKKSVDDYKKMMDSRKEAYKNAADIKVNVDDLTPAEVASELVKELALTGRLH